MPLVGKVKMPYNDWASEDRVTVLTITAKGQVTLKQDLLKHLGGYPPHSLYVVVRINFLRSIAGAFWAEQTCETAKLVSYTGIDGH
jgi:hypothetical protein